jgi:hypothetical protein
MSGARGWRVGIRFFVLLILVPAANFLPLF